VNYTVSRRVLWALLVSSHPIPSLVVAVLTTVFAWAVGMEWWQVVLVFIAMLTNQLGIGLGNDWLDQARDHTAGRTDKPLATGTISASTARNTAIGLGGVALVASAVLGVAPLVCQVVMLFAGWWYNAHAKSHWTSPLSYLLGFALLPVFPTLAWTPPILPPWWVVAVAGLLGIAAHFANALPDLLDDAVTGIRGLPQIVGPKASGTIAAGMLLIATMLITLLGVGLPVWVRIVSATIALGIGMFSAALAFRPAPPRMIFPLVMVAAGVSAGAIVLEFAGA
jgi:4-hydroxybenzoate polyprenyltransferase